MLLDHIDRIIYSQSFSLMTVIGRFAFILFAFILAYNYAFNSRNKIAYLKRLLLFAIISQPFYIYAFGFSKLNIFFTLWLGLGIVWLYEHRTNVINQWIIGYALILILFFGHYIEYHIMGVLLVISSFTYIKTPSVINLSIMLSIAFLTNNLFQLNKDTIIFSLMGVMSYLIIFFIKQLNPPVIPINKWLFYCFYPLHLIIIKYISLLLNY